MTSRMAFLSGLTSVDPDAGVPEEPIPTPEQPRIELSPDFETEAWWQAQLDKAIAEVAAEKREEESK